MDERTQLSLGVGLLIITAAIVFAYAFISIPTIVIVLTVIGMATGTLLIGTSDRPVSR